MSYVLPPLKKENLLRYDYFPNHMLCFIYRNWEMLTPEDIAKTLQTDTKTVTDLAVEMGLTATPVCNPEWKVRGYITIIRSNWHLLSYKQIRELLGWDEEKLAFILKEDDFLDIKLGSFKPDTGDLLYSPLTDEEKAELPRIRRATEEVQAKLDPISVQSFDFNTMFRRTPLTEPIYEEGKLRYVYSYCALYGDTFLEDPTVSFPEELLRAYQSIGITGVWCQAVLYKLVEFEFEPSMSERYKERQEGLRNLIKHLAKYGLKLYLYINEPRAMPNAFFEKYPHMKGLELEGRGVSSLCTSVPEVQNYLRNAIKELVTQAPGLGGFFTITASENQTNCHFAQAGTNCPRCSQRPREEVIAEVNRIIMEGAKAADPDIRVIAYTWAWRNQNRDELAEKIIRLLPQGVDVLTVSENYMVKQVHGVEVSQADYAISMVGPSEWTKRGWHAAKQNGNKTVAKTQFNNSWECSAVPYLPVFECVYKHWQNLAAEDTDGIMAGWTLGGYPSPTLAMADVFFAEKDKKPTLRQLYDRVFPADTNDTVAQACHLFSEAFENNFPFSVSTLYMAPPNYGPAVPLFRTPTNHKATMVGYPYDDINSWKSQFPKETYWECWKDLTEQWKQGLDILHTIPEEKFAASEALQDLRDCAEGAYYHFRSTYLQVNFVMQRDGGEDFTDTVKEEQELAWKLANICAHNPTVGYEASNHYYYTKTMLMEKYVNCDWLLNQ